MIRPFERFLPFYINEFISMGKIYLVAQTYTRHIDTVTEGKKTGILISDYDDPGLAKGHLSALTNAKDKYGVILNLTNEKHRSKLQEMLQINSPYALYWAAVKSKQLLQKQVNLKYKDNIRRFIENNTNWQISRDTSISPKLKVIFGELFVIIKYRNEETRVKFEVIEKS